MDLNSPFFNMIIEIVLPLSSMDTVPDPSLTPFLYQLKGCIPMTGHLLQLFFELISLTGCLPPLLQ
jgi:hypothetical protein